MGNGTDDFACVIHPRVENSSPREYAMGERDLGHLTVTGPRSEQTRVRRFLTMLLLSRVNTSRPRASSSANRTGLPGTSRIEDRNLLANEGLRLGLMPTINRMRFVSMPPAPIYTHPLAIIISGQPNGRHCDSKYDDTHRPRRYYKR